MTRTVETLMIWRRFAAGEGIDDIRRRYEMTTAEVMRALRVEGRYRVGR